MATIDELRSTLRNFESQPESYGYDLRLSLAEIVLHHLEQKGWTQKKLAEAAHVKPSFVTRIIHSDSNFTADSAGRLLHALGVRVEFRDVGDAVATSDALEGSYGKEEATYTTFEAAGSGAYTVVEGTDVDTTVIGDSSETR